MAITGIINNEMLPNASPVQGLLTEAIKQAIGQRTVDNWQAWKENSTRQGRKERLKGFLAFGVDATRDVLMSNMSNISMGAAMSLYTFDWNKTDKQLQEEMKATEAAMFSAGGRLVATGAVRFTGFAVTEKIRNRYPTIDPEIIADMNDENRDELRSAIVGMLNSMRNSLQKQAILSTYMSGRQLFGYKEEPGEKDRKPWILSDKLDEIAESPKDKNFKAFLTSFKDEFEDQFFDMGYLITNGVQTHYNMQKRLWEQKDGVLRLVKYTPDVSEPQSYTFVHGTEEQVKTAINSARLGAVHLADKDVGQIAMIGVGKAMKADLSERTLTLTYRDGPNGSSNKPEGRSAVKTIKIPNIKRTVDYDKIKLLSKPVMSGPYRVTAKLSDGHELQGYFSSASEGESFFRPWIEQCCNGNLIEFHVASLPTNPKKRLPVARFEVANGRLFVQDDTADDAKAKYIARDGKMKRTKLISFRLNTSRKPDNIDMLISLPFGVNL
jgi:hypothetical protein